MGNTSCGDLMDNLCTYIEFWQKEKKPHYGADMRTRYESLKTQRNDLC